MQDQTTIAAAWHTEAARGDESPEHPVTAISARLLRSGRATLGDSREMFAARAGTDLDLVVAIEDGTRPAWDVPGPELTPIVDALRPVQGDAFWTGVACDLLLANLLSGDDVTAGVAAGESLGDPDRQGLARMLLRWAIRGAGSVGVPLLPTAERELLRQQATKLTAADSSDAWVGAEILAAFGGVR